MPSANAATPMMMESNSGSNVTRQENATALESQPQCAPPA
jgi:hypothetical protein